MRWRLRRFKDFTISNIKEEIRSIQPTTLMLIKDGVLFYIPMVVMLVASVVVMSRVHHSFFTDITVPFLMALYSFCSARFIIHTRETIGQPTSIQQVEEMSLSTAVSPSMTLRGLAGLLSACSLWDWHVLCSVTCV
ncbi:hypothetical protein EDC04DRAFT_642218 [Pisolithus marmoratus]|nr:hypothetical protein EDC04DRAFT_642218 [Pisolithus marmoratus]